MATFMKHQKCHVSFCAIVIVGYGWRWRCLKMAAGLLEFRLRKALLIQAILTLIVFRSSLIREMCLAMCINQLFTYFCYIKISATASEKNLIFHDMYPEKKGSQENESP